ncbi:uncharacterized protein LOC119676732 [Teleopsis dalmanni]|uniref:uncharacterized protein LOC119676732 n=1 Tax=Teleopsis dalmanni TaxID=139649 RepID=UPI0018CC8F44|nr:uncharacterized protein LOC119676732 [Teleopsis dalmanni]
MNGGQNKCGKDTETQIAIDNVCDDNCMYKLSTLEHSYATQWSAADSNCLTNVNVKEDRRYKCTTSTTNISIGQFNEIREYRNSQERTEKNEEENVFNYLPVFDDLWKKTAPPPYQPQQLLERLNPQDCVADENSQNGKNFYNTSTGSTGSTASNIKMQSELCVRIPDSLTTDGEGQNACPLIWCQVAYWEMSQRVGDRYLAKKSSVNIYSDDPCKGDSNDDMCLNELAKQRRTPSPDNVKKIRLKIGLGMKLFKLI